MILAKVGADLIDEIAPVVLHIAARVADQVKLVIGVRQLPASGAVGAEVGFPSQPEPSEERQRPVDGGQVDSGIVAPHLGRDLIRGEMAPRRPEHIPHEPARVGEPVTALAKVGPKIDRVCHRDMISESAQLRTIRNYY